MKKHLLLAMLALALPLFAEKKCIYLQLPCWEVDLSGGVDALYWVGCGQNFPYAIYADVPVPGVVFANTVFRNLAPGYGWGVRVYAGLCDKCSGRSGLIEWLHYNHTTTATAGLRPSLGELVTVSNVDNFTFKPASSIRATQQDRYDAVNLRLSQRFCQICWGEFSAYLGGGWREILVKQQIRATDSLLISEDNTLHFNGGAILFGLEAQSRLGCGFGMNMRFGGIVGIGGLLFRTRAVGISNNEVGVLNELEPRQTRCVPGFEMLGSIQYVTSWECYLLKAEIGYRAEYYFNLKAVDTFISEDAPSDQENRGYGGPFIGVSIAY